MSKSIEKSLELTSMTRFCEAEASFTRPNNTTQYTAQDLVTSALSLDAVGCIAFTLPDWTRNMSGLIYKIFCAKSGDTTTNASFTMYLWNRPPTVINAVDNTPYPSQIPVWKDRDAFIGTIACGTQTVGMTGGGTYALSAAANLYYALPGGGNTIYGLLTVSAAYVPIASEQFYFRITCIYPPY
jgi:hypothetical protein